MKITTCLLLLVAFGASCQTMKPDAKHPDKNGPVVVSLERTPCFGRCPVYDIKLYENGLLLYNAVKNTDTTGCFYAVLNKDEVAAIKDKFNKSGFMQMADRYPEDNRAPSDLPSVVLYFNNGTAQKTVRDKRWETPIALAELQTTIEELVRTKKLQNCDTNN
ncbi:MAG TPA: DUF6438 domain-containing protein [Chitinophagales bacterium]|nr:DUF6438 domain-containing protein [Chitinophagales bacterium]